MPASHRKPRLLQASSKKAPKACPRAVKSAPATPAPKDEFIKPKVEQADDAFAEYKEAAKSCNRHWFEYSEDGMVTFEERRKHKKNTKEKKSDKTASSDHKSKKQKVKQEITI